MTEPTDDQQPALWLTPEMKASGTKVVRILREMGYSYEDIPGQIWNVTGERMLKPWEFYELANPHKSAEQVEAWRRKHHPHG